MDKLANKKSKIHLPNIKLIKKGKNFNKKKLLKFNESLIDNSITKNCFLNEKIKKNNIFLQYENRTQMKAQNNPYNTNTDFFKMKLKNKTKIFSYNIKGMQQKNSSLKYIYKSPESNEDLRRYTNNSSSFRFFNGQDNPYQSYTIKKLKKIEKPILLQSPKNIENISSTRFFSNNSNFYSNNSHKNVLNNNIFEYQKENSKIFIKIPPIDLSELVDKSNENDLESRDKVDIKILENEKLREKIRLSLLQDINHDKKHNKLYVDYLKPINHYIDFYQDIYVIPHIKNKFTFTKPIKDLEKLSQKLCDKNLFHKQIVLILNRVKIIRELLIKQKEIDLKKMFEEEQDMRFDLKFNNLEELKVNQYEKKYEKYELQDSFEKCTNHQVISFADKKARECIFTKNFYKNK